MEVPKIVPFCLNGGNCGDRTLSILDIFSDDETCLG